MQPNSAAEIVPAEVEGGEEGEGEGRGGGREEGRGGRREGEREEGRGRRREEGGGRRGGEGGGRRGREEGEGGGRWRGEIGVELEVLFWVTWDLPHVRSDQTSCLYRYDVMQNMQVFVLLCKCNSGVPFY